jgi:hypothetical protein
MNGQADAYVRAAIQGEVARLASANTGERNTTLFKCTRSLASLGLREGQIIHHLKPVAESIGLRGRELYTTIKSGVRAGHANLRTDLSTKSAPSGRVISKPSIRSQWPWPMRSLADDEGRRPTFFAGGDEGPRIAGDELRRHVYRDGERPVRIKIKRQHGYVNWYRVTDGEREGWQAGKPAAYVPTPYVGALDPFDAELTGDVLYWPEGEKDVDTLTRQGLPAFTFGGTGDGLPDGAMDWVRGRQLIIFADNDQAGRNHAEQKAALAAGVAASVKVVEFPDLPSGGDVSDYLKTNSVDDLERLVEAAPQWTPREPPTSSTFTAKSALLTCTLSDVAPEKVEWVWPGRLAVGKLTMIAGEPGLGKSQLAISIAAAVTTGGRWPDCKELAPKGTVIILSAEDGLADTMRPRFDAAGGDASRVVVIRAVQRMDTEGRQSFNLAADLKLLEDEIARHGDVRLIYIDPVSSYLGKIDSHKNADVRSVLEPLAEMAERLRVAILAITHLSKGEGKAINRLVGSIAFAAAARTVFAVVADPDDDAGLRRLLLQVKNNIAPPQTGLAFRLVQLEVAPDVIGSAVDWDATTPVCMTVDQALRGPAADGDGTAKDDAIEFLSELLAGGPVDVLDIEAEARAAAMLSETKRLKESKPFRTAARSLGVIKQRHGFGPGARVQWSLPTEHFGGSEAGQEGA